MKQIDVKASEDFHSALTKGVLQNVLSKLQLQRSELLSFYDVKEIIKPKNETYLGIRTIAVDQIIGSEGRYRDFSNAFYPKKATMKKRWARVSDANYSMIDLPPISVYKLGNAYFVRDGNHRVSVAKSIGRVFIDAEVVELDTQIELKPGMTNRQIRRSVIEYERQRVAEETGIDRYIDYSRIRFTEPGRYTEMIRHIKIHQNFIRITGGRELTFAEAAASWYRTVYEPITAAAAQQHIAASFPGRTEADVYIWIVKHWNRMKGRHGFAVKPSEAVRDFSLRHRISPVSHFWARLKRVLGKREQ
jgi:hypothetical protein